LPAWNVKAGTRQDLALAWHGTASGPRPRFAPSAAVPSPLARQKPKIPPEMGRRSPSCWSRVHDCSRRASWPAGHHRQVDRRQADQWHPARDLERSLRRSTTCQRIFRAPATTMARPRRRRAQSAGAGGGGAGTITPAWKERASRCGVTQMLVSSGAYSANGCIITTADEILDQLISISTQSNSVVILTYKFVYPCDNPRSFY
jgi:hypothetical protein